MIKVKIPLGEGKRLCDKYDAPMVVVFSLHDSGDSFGVLTYGQNAKLCRHAADIGNKIADAILGSKIIPSVNEPAHLPDYPEGWVQDTLPARLRTLVHKWRETELEIRSDGESFRDSEYRELLLEVADDVEAAMAATKKE